MNTSRLTLVGLVTALAIAIVPTGALAGTPKNAAGAKAAVAAYFLAMQSNNARVWCGLMTPAAQRAVVNAAGTNNCQQAFKVTRRAYPLNKINTMLADLGTSRVVIRGNKAVVNAQTDYVNGTGLVYQGGGWRLTV